MRIIHMSDIHGDMKMFERAVRLIKSKSDAKVVAITGDLAGRVLEGDKRKHFLGLSENLRRLRNGLYKESHGKIATQRDAAEAIISEDIEFEGEPEKAKRFAKDYIELEKETKQGMRDQYETFKQRLEDLSQDREVVLIPGNWDGKCMDNYLAKFNIHNRKKGVKVDDVHFVGYGGAREIPEEIPEEWLFKFNEDEAHAHFVKNTDADELTIALTHTPIAGYEGHKDAHSGSWALRSYMFQKTPDAILQGHTHLPRMTRDNEAGTIIVNSGNLGKYDKSKGGTFVELEMDEGGWVKPYRVFDSLEDHDVHITCFDKRGNLKAS